jgi:hypothetical protein
MATPAQFARALAEMRRAHQDGFLGHPDDALERFISSVAKIGRSCGLTLAETLELGRAVDRDLCGDEVIPAFEAQVIEEIMASVVAELRAAKVRYPDLDMWEIERGLAEILAAYDGRAHLHA